MQQRPTGRRKTALVVAQSSPGYGALLLNPFRPAVPPEEQRLIRTVSGLVLCVPGHQNGLSRAPNIRPGGGGPGLTLGRAKKLMLGALWAVPMMGLLAARFILNLKGLRGGGSLYVCPPPAPIFF